MTHKLLALVLVVGWNGSSSPCPATDELSGTMEVMAVIDHARDPWHDFRAHMLQWWMDEHEYHITALRAQRFTNSEERAERDERVNARRAKVQELRTAQRLADRAARSAMVEIHGWDPAQAGERFPSPRVGGAVVIECRTAAIMRKARDMKPGGFVSYIVEEESFGEEDGSLQSHPKRYEWNPLRPILLDAVRRPDGWLARDPAMMPLRFETVDQTGVVNVNVEHTLYRRLDTQHPAPVIAARVEDQSAIAPAVREIAITIELVDTATGAVEKDLTADGALILRSSHLGTSVGYGGGDSGLRHTLRLPYAAPPDGKAYRFTVQRVLMERK